MRERGRRQVSELGGGASARSMGAGLARRRRLRRRLVEYDADDMRNAQLSTHQKLHSKLHLRVKCTFTAALSSRRRLAGRSAAILRCRIPPPSSGDVQVSTLCGLAQGGGTAIDGPFTTTRSALSLRISQSYCVFC